MDATVLLEQETNQELVHKYLKQVKRVFLYDSHGEYHQDDHTDSELDHDGHYDTHSDN